MNNDLYFLRHIVDEVRFLKTYCKGLPKSKFIYDEMLRKAVQKSLENISVAAYNLSPGIKQRYNMIDWNMFAELQIRMRTRFLTIDYELLSNIVKYELPRLEKAINMMVEAEFPGYMVKKGGGIKVPEGS
ncbi:MAG: DUF86 domain-containing protein [Thermoplasmatota archaeon]